MTPHIIIPGRKGKNLDPSSRSLAQRYEVVHVVSSPHLRSSLRGFVTLCRYSDFSVPDLLVATNHCKMVLPGFSETCSPFLTFLSPGFVGGTGQRVLHMNCPGCLAAPHAPSANPKFLAGHLNKHPGIPNTLFFRLLCDFLKNPLCIHIICRGLSLSRCREMSYSETY